MRLLIISQSTFPGTDIAAQAQPLPGLSFSVLWPSILCLHSLGVQCPLQKVGMEVFSFLIIQRDHRNVSSFACQVLESLAAQHSLSFYRQHLAMLPKLCFNLLHSPGWAWTYDRDMSCVWLLGLIWFSVRIWDCLILSCHSSRINVWFQFTLFQSSSTIGSQWKKQGSKERHLLSRDFWSPTLFLEPYGPGNPVQLLITRTERHPMLCTEACCGVTGWLAAVSSLLPCGSHMSDSAPLPW